MTKNQGFKLAAACLVAAAPAWVAAQALQPPLFTSTHQLTLSAGLSVRPDFEIIEDGVFTEAIWDGSDRQTTEAVVHADKLAFEYTDDQGRTVQRLETLYKVDTAYWADSSSREVLSFAYGFEKTDMQSPWSLDFSVTRQGQGGLNVGGLYVNGFANVQVDEASGDAALDLPQVWVDGVLAAPADFIGNTDSGEWYYTFDRDNWWGESLTHTVSVRGGAGSGPWGLNFGGASDLYDFKKVWVVEPSTFRYDYRDVVVGVPAIPEPSVWGLMLVGLAALTMRTHRRVEAPVGSAQQP